MKLLILHLSDLHISGASNAILQRPNEIAASVFHEAREATCCVIALTGDATFSSAADQFALVSEFLSAIKNALLTEGCPRVEIISVPGNHDCELVPERLPRSRIIDGLTEHPEDAADASIIEACTSVQQNYFVFRQETTTLPAKFEDRLWSEYEIDVDGHPVRISAINASWMSRLKEKPGTLVFPIDQYSEVLAEPAATRLIMVHHPLNWYVQGTYHPLKVALRSHATAILSGHEHFASSGLVQDTDAGASLYFEAAALQPHEANSSAGFSALTFDLAANEVEEARLEISRTGDVLVGKRATLDLASITEQAGELTGLTPDFASRLRDPGADFKNAQNRPICIDDFFIYPELQALSRGDADSVAIVDSENLIAGDPENARIMFLAEQGAGKTSLLLQAFKSLRKRKLTPIYLRAGDLKGHSESEVAKFFQRAAEKQYQRPDDVIRGKKSHIVALVDDIERLGGDGRAAHRVLKYLATHCTGIFATACSGFEFSELIYRDAWEATKDFRSYQIAPFGARLKHRLIRKWCLCGSVSTVQELEAKVHSVEGTLNAILGKNLVPGVPIYILILLQSIEQNQQHILSNSHIGTYYAYMIDKNLTDAGIPPSKFVEIKGYLSELAWFYKSAEIRECSVERLKHFNSEYSIVQNTVDLSQRLEQLSRARILSRRGDNYSFAYPYIYYYFVGQYVAKNLSREATLKPTVAAWCETLHQKDHAHCVLFLAHHVNDTWLVTKIADELDKCFDDAPVLCLNDDIGPINALVEKTSQLVLEFPDVDRNKEGLRKLSDDMGREGNGTHDVVDVVASSFNNISRMLVTSAILGQVLKSYYGDIRREDRQRLIKKVFSASLRFLHGFVMLLADDPENLVAELEKQLGSRLSEYGEVERKRLIGQLTYQFIGLLSSLFIKRTAHNVTSDDLKEDVAQVAEDVGTPAFRLIRAASQLERPGNIPTDEIKVLAEDIKGNPFAHGILQTLAALHIQYFHMRDQDRQRLCTSVGISLLAPRASDLVMEGTKATRA